VIGVAMKLIGFKFYEEQACFVVVFPRWAPEWLILSVINKLGQRNPGLYVGRRAKVVRIEKPA
jgi:hypothetical protein